MTPSVLRILTIGGSDSSAGAGIQADLKTIAALGGYGLSAVTAVTAQTADRVVDIHPLRFDPGLAFQYVTDLFQWIPFDVPLGWLQPGPNRFFVTERSPEGSWDHNNLRIGALAADGPTDSWWCETDRLCCHGDDAPGSRFTAGEAMIFLELSDPVSTSRETREWRTDRQLVTVLLAVADSLLYAGNAGAAERCYGSVLDHGSWPNHERSVAVAEFGIGLIAMDSGDLDRAETKLKRAYEYFRNSGGLLFHYRSLGHLARLYESMDRTGEAARYRRLQQQLPVPIQLQPTDRG